ncbi:MAG: iron-containing alcohol dehydrogenase, partial [Candidatus Eisenbacteria bacterium]|nr:iron-containing alcohol dehydrogenase [Candidatus Latescibacterota bacterium]MBD3301430.1 iron-containing alcohol dehydrogenase [Candidatus Eisenbacteria bacterium]
MGPQPIASPPETLVNSRTTSIDRLRKSLHRIGFPAAGPIADAPRNTESAGRILDLRPREDFERRHIPGASRIAPEEIEIPFLRPPRRRFLVVTDRDAGQARAAARRLRALGHEAIALDAPISRWPGPWEEGPERAPCWEPSPLLQRHRPRSGGGAAVDLAKGAAAMATNTESPTVKDFLEGVGRGLKLVEEPLPVLAMPTTAGTGAEATKNAVISSYDPPFKKSLRDDRMVPRVALVDPELGV